MHVTFSDSTAKRILNFRPHARAYMLRTWIEMISAASVARFAVANRVCMALGIMVGAAIALEGLQYFSPDSCAANTPSFAIAECLLALRDCGATVSGELVSVVLARFVG